jgi:hypothetical protein
VLLALLAALDAGDATQPDWPDLVADAVNGFAAGVSSIVDRKELATRLRAAIGPIGDEVGQRRTLRSQVEDLAAVVDRYRELGADPRTVLDGIDDVTRRQVAEVAEIWQLAALVPQLGPDVDLVVQLEDTLQAVPVAHLPHDGVPLWTRVRSTRVSLSVLVTILQQRNNQRSTTGRSRMMALSHFYADDQVNAGYATGSGCLPAKTG